MAADHVQHLSWREWEREGMRSAVAATYSILDDAVGALLESAPADGNVLVVSDHGAGALEGVVNLNAWLASLGLLTFGSGRTDAARRAADSVFGLRRFVPARLRYAVKQRLPGLRERAYSGTDWAAVDWSTTRAFAYGTFGNVVVNVRGREAQGIVEPGAEYERVRAQVAEQALELRGPDGEPIVAAVHRREDLFDGPELHRVPDLLIEFHEYRWLGKGNLKSGSTALWDRIEIEPGSTHSYVGSHRHEGIVCLSGPAIAPGVELSAGIADVTPTVLYLLDAPIPADCEGRVLFEAIRTDLLDERPPRYDDTPATMLVDGSRREARESRRGRRAASRPRLPRMSGVRDDLRDEGTQLLDERA